MNAKPKNPADVTAEVMNQFGKSSSRFLPLLLLAILGITLYRSTFQVGPGEVAVVRRLGKEVDRRGSGLHFRYPIIEEVNIVNVENVRRMEGGFRGDKAVAEEAQMLTGDENIVDAHMIVQYRVTNPSQYLFRLAEPEATLRATAEVALRSVIGRTTIDAAITTGRSTVQTETRELLQKLMDAYLSGMTITEVKLQSVDPPEEVRDAFHEVVRAREKKAELINQSQGYRADILPRALGEAKKQILDAEAYKTERILRAQGDAQRFDAVYAEYEKAPQITKERLYLEAMENVLKSTPQKTILDAKLPGSTLPLLEIGQRAAVAKKRSRKPPQSAGAPSSRQTERTSR